MPVNLWFCSVVFKGVVSKMHFPRFYFSKQLIYLHAGWAWASMKWDVCTKSTSFSETNRNCSPASGATTSSQNVSASPAADVLPPYADMTFVATCMPSMGGFDTSGIRSRSINIKVLASWCESQSALGESAQVWLELAERWCLPSKVRSSHICRWWIYGENQSQIDCHPFYLHLNCLPTQLRIQHNLIKSVKIYFCLRNNVLLCSYLMSCELTCFNKSFAAYYIHSLDGNFKIWPLKWDSFHNFLMMALRTVHFIFAFGLEL